MSTRISVCFNAYGLNPAQADVVSVLFGQALRNEGLQHEVVQARKNNEDGTVDVGVSSPEPVSFSRFCSWRENFEERLQGQVAQLAPGATVSFEWGFPDQEAEQASAAAAVPVSAPVDWAEFTPRLATVLIGMPEGAVVSLAAGSNQCLQFLQGWICSVGGSMTAEQERSLAAAGWQAPTPSTAPNWHCEYPIGRSACEQTASRATEVMRNVLGINSPSELTVEVWNDQLDGCNPEVAVLGLSNPTT
ncbi:TY-Chap domain-containing protein [Nocardia asteroides]|uniref:TY-Chap domain-containing protein n=1 Tax=Nocardia asteroides TaxID=1824 RepID=UPI001E510B0F|nr:hypothetical protein [Nocardia asteroides]UGT58006.1 hypothetical protein LTT85_14710 [Nocardia asteroides]